MTGDFRREIDARLASLDLAPVRRAEIVEELAQDLEERYEAMRRDGIAETDARRAVLEELRDPDALARYMRPLRQSHPPMPITPGAPRHSWLADLWQDIRYATRMLRKQPGFAAAVVVTLALGIGANTAIFSLVNATLFERLPFAERDRVAYVYRNVGSVFAYPMYAALRDGNDVLDGLAAWGGIEASLTADGQTELVNGYIVTGNFFDVLGIAPSHGRLLSPGDDVVPGGHPVAAISHEFWRARFAGRPDIVGREVRLNGHAFTIVGIAPPGFSGPVLGGGRPLYVPMMMQAVIRPPRAGYSGEMNPDLLRHPTNSWLFGVGRLKPGVTPAQASAQLAALAAQHVKSAGLTMNPPPVPVVPVDEANPDQRRQWRSTAYLLGGVVGAVLLIACANIANLLFARSASRRRELAVRMAVGASRARLLRQLLTESVLLSCAGGLAGVGLAWLVGRMFMASPPPPGALPIAVDFAIDGRVLAFSLALSMLTGLIFGAAPAIRASRGAIVPSLKDGVSAGVDGGRRIGLQKALVVGEVALSMLLLIPAGLFVRSLQASRAIDPGIDVERIISAPLNINLLRYTRDQGRDFYRRVIERAGRIPGVESAGLSRLGVLAGRGRIVGIMVDGRDGYSDEHVQSEGGNNFTLDPTLINMNVVSAGFFRTLGIPIMRGRDFDARDSEDRTLVAILNETAATVHFGPANPIGQRVNFGGRGGAWREVIGVVRDSKYLSLNESPLAMAYLPFPRVTKPG